MDRQGGDFYDERVTADYLAHRHGGTRSPNTVMEEPAVLAQLGDLTGLRILDLGCGDGAFARLVLERGAAAYVGVDGSAAMVEAAAEHGPAVQLIVSSIEDVEIEPQSFDLITARMSLHYVADLDAVLRKVRAGLAPEGRLLITVVHPVITSHDNEPEGPRTTWTVDRYFEGGERRRAWFGAEVTWYHRTVESYVGALLASGFSLQALSECEPQPDLLADDPAELARRRRVPLVLLLAAGT